MQKLAIHDLDLKGKKVLVRVDFNVPMNKDGTIADDTRIRESVPTIKHILERGGSVILMSHLGRPKGPEAKSSLAPCAKALSHLLGQEVAFATDSTGEDAKKKARALKPKEVLLLENLRFNPAEEKPELDPEFAKRLAELADVYVNDAFGTAHRSHSSTAVIAQYFPEKSAAGLLIGKEVAFFEKILLSPKRPFFAIIGGAKISTKMGVLKSLVTLTDGIFIGGGMAFTFLKAQGFKIGNSIFEEDQIGAAKDLMQACTQKKVPLFLPTDLVIADSFKEDANSRVVSAEEGIPAGWQGMDIGPQTIQKWKSALHSAKTVFWNGPLGVFEFKKFATGTHEIAKAVAALDAITIVGGGDSVSAINQLQLASKFSHVSTGGGASLEYIEFGHLPGIDALSNRK